MAFAVLQRSSRKPHKSDISIFLLHSCHISIWYIKMNFWANFSQKIRIFTEIHHCVLEAKKTFLNLENRLRHSFKRLSCIDSWNVSTCLTKKWPQWMNTCVLLFWLSKKKSDYFNVKVTAVKKTLRQYSCWKVVDLLREKGTLHRPVKFYFQQ